MYDVLCTSYVVCGESKQKIQFFRPKSLIQRTTFLPWLIVIVRIFIVSMSTIVTFSLYIMRNNVSETVLRTSFEKYSEVKALINQLAVNGTIFFYFLVSLAFSYFYFSYTCWFLVVAYTEKNNIAKISI